MYNKSNLEIYRVAGNAHGLDHIWLEEGQTWATDGKRLVSVSVPDEKNDEFPLNGSHKIVSCIKPIALDAGRIKNVIQSIPKSPSIPICKNAILSDLKEGEKATLSTWDGGAFIDTQVRIMDQIRPNIENVFPKDTPTVSIGFRMDVLFGALDVFSKCKAREIQIEVRDDKTAIVISGKTECGQDIKALVMPCRLAK